MFPNKSLHSHPLIFDSQSRGGFNNARILQTMTTAEAQNIHFVPAEAEDFDYFYALRKETMFEHFQRAGKDWPEEEELCLHRQRFDVRFLRMIYLNNERIGFFSTAPHEERGFIIELFCIEPKHQKKGIGTRVMEMVLSESALQGQEIHIDVLHGNPAAHLYEGLGFTRTSKEHDKLAFYTLQNPQKPNLQQVPQGCIPKNGS